MFDSHLQLVDMFKHIMHKPELCYCPVLNLRTSKLKRTISKSQSLETSTQ